MCNDLNKLGVMDMYADVHKGGASALHMLILTLLALSRVMTDISTFPN